MTLFDIFFSLSLAPYSTPATPYSIIPGVRQDPGFVQGATPSPQKGTPIPLWPIVLQKPKTAHLASRLTRFILGFSYFFFLFFSISVPPKDSIEV
jgi:hypothetical protein